MRRIGALDEHSRDRLRFREDLLLREVERRARAWLPAKWKERLADVDGDCPTIALSGAMASIFATTSRVVVSVVSFGQTIFVTALGFDGGIPRNDTLIAYSTPPSGVSSVFNIPVPSRGVNVTSEPDESVAVSVTLSTTSSEPCCSRTRANASTAATAAICEVEANCRPIDRS